MQEWIRGLRHRARSPLPAEWGAANEFDGDMGFFGWGQRYNADQVPCEYDFTGKGKAFATSQRAPGVT
eukprot:6631924-Pyramimonas_sp.AAC.1